MSRFGDGTLKQSLYESIMSDKYEWQEETHKVSLMEFLVALVEVVADICASIKFELEEEND